MEKIHLILQDWFERDLPELVQRDFDYSEYEEINLILTLIGVRRSGKTYSMYLATRYLLDKGVPKKNIIYINLEDDRLYPLEGGELDNILQTYKEYYSPHDGHRIYLLVDEPQSIEGWERWVRRIQETREEVKIILSGSSSKLLSSEIASTLRGRTISKEVFPFTFKEFLRYKGFKTKDIEHSPRKSELKNHLREYLKYGGFPEVIFSETKKSEILREYFRTIFFRDIIERYEIRKIDLIEDFGRILMDYSGKLFSYTKIRNYFKTIGRKVSKNTLSEYMNYFTSVYLMFEVPLFSYKIKDRLQYPRKIYPVDTGLRNAIIGNEPMGRLCEITVFLHLRRKKQKIHYWKDRNGKEIDFVIVEGKNPKKLIQVCYDLKEENKERELRSLKVGMEEFSLDKSTLITWDESGVEEIEEKKVEKIPLWKFLLNN
ncbi:MAG: ATP-binding protein [Thermoplasmata archaeon]